MINDPFLDTPSGRCKADGLRALSRFFPDGVPVKPDGPGVQRPVHVPLARYCDRLSAGDALLFASCIHDLAARLLRLHVGLDNRAYPQFALVDPFQHIETLLDALEHDLVIGAFDIPDMETAQPAEGAPGPGRVGDGYGDDEVEDQVIEPADDPRLIVGDGVMPVIHDEPPSGKRYDLMVTCNDHATFGLYGNGNSLSCSGRPEEERRAIVDLLVRALVLLSPIEPSLAPHDPSKPLEPGRSIDDGGQIPP